MAPPVEAEGAIQNTHQHGGNTPTDREATLLYVIPLLRCAPEALGTNPGFYYTMDHEEASEALHGVPKLCTGLGCRVLMLRSA